MDLCIVLSARVMRSPAAPGNDSAWGAARNLQFPITGIEVP
jgi:hypothetical protein